MESMNPFQDCEKGNRGSLKSFSRDIMSVKNNFQNYKGWVLNEVIIYLPSCVFAILACCIKTLVFGNADTVSENECRTFGPSVV